MNAYQTKWLDLLRGANLPGWEIVGDDDDIKVTMPHVTDLKLIRDNVPEILGAMALDIDLPKERLKFIFINGFEHFEYIINPGGGDLEEL